jgi:transposase, IS5 family
MYLREQRDQLSFKDFFLPFGGQLSGDNRWIKLAELIPWDELEMTMHPSSARVWCSSQAIRMALGALIIKARGASSVSVWLLVIWPEPLSV